MLEHKQEGQRGARKSVMEVPGPPQNFLDYKGTRANAEVKNFRMEPFAHALPDVNGHTDTTRRLRTGGQNDSGFFVSFATFSLVPKAD